MSPILLPAGLALVAALVLLPADGKVVRRTLGAGAALFLLPMALFFGLMDWQAALRQENAAITVLALSIASSVGAIFLVGALLAGVLRATFRVVRAVRKKYQQDA